MKTTPPRSPRPQSRKPNHDVAAAVVDEQEQVSNAWATIRLKLSPTAAAAGDEVIGCGGLSLLDIQALEFADYVEMSAFLAEQRQELDGGARNGTLVGQLCSVRLQSRKHMRAIATFMNPGNDSNQLHPTLPDSVADAYQVMSDAGDFGDDLVN